MLEPSQCYNYSVAKYRGKQIRYFKTEDEDLMQFFLYLYRINNRSSQEGMYTYWGSPAAPSEIFGVSLRSHTELGVCLLYIDVRTALYAAVKLRWMLRWSFVHAYQLMSFLLNIFSVFDPYRMVHRICLATKKYSQVHLEITIQSR